MPRAITAIYRTHAAADRVRDGLDRMGLSGGHVAIIPETVVQLDTASPSRSTAPAREELDDALDRLHDLHLPEDDTRIYQQAIRNGDYVVSVQTEDDADIARIEELMRHPEDAYSFDDLDSRYRDADLVPRRRPLDDGFDERVAGRREDEQLSPYTRYYRRDLALTPAIAMAPIGTR